MECERPERVGEVGLLDLLEVGGSAERVDAADVLFPGELEAPRVTAREERHHEPAPDDPLAFSLWHRRVIVPAQTAVCEAWNWTFPGRRTRWPASGYIGVVPMTLELPPEARARLEAEARRRGITVDELVAEMSRQLPAPNAITETGAWSGFFGCGDSGDPEWATRDIHELRHELAQRSSEVA